MEKNAERVLELSKIPIPPSETNLFQLPKGRKKLTKETKLNCALREFSEETGIDRSAINVYPTLNFTLVMVHELTNEWNIRRYCLIWKRAHAQ